jgi:hypothetical protein
VLTDDLDDFEQRVVDDVQQWLHDSFVDTRWPQCRSSKSSALVFREMVDM